MEYWHPRKDCEGAMEFGKKELVPKEFRKNVGLVHLVGLEKETQRIMVVVTHLMTKSRDNEKKTKYPGEIRAGELASLKRVVEEHTGVNEAVMLMGDFNIQPMEHDIFANQLKNQSNQDNAMYTSFKQQSNGDWVFDWRKNGRGALLADAFAGRHGWRDPTPGDQKHCTSRNSERCEWIDYVWYSPAQLELVDLSETRIPPNPIPDITEPSDHLPLGVRMKFKSSL